ncbi:MAG TPA: ABC transporter permease, partial [Gemmatimonadaceae bacterium]|nr:ABC transporter permease [Gemmatimonadaceae bacterium]
MSDFRVPPLNGGERLYRALLHLYPRRFRLAFDRDLIEAFRDQRRDALERRTPRPLFALMIVHDLLTQALAERASAAWSALRRRPVLVREELPMSGSQLAFRFADLRHATRRLLRVPSFTITTVFVLALGVGATTAVFSVVNGVLLRPLPYANPQRLVALTHSAKVSGVVQVEQSDATVLLYQKHVKALTGVAAWRDQDVNLELVDGQASTPERIAASQVTANIFQVLGVPPLVGRDFRSGEDRPDAA